MNNRLFTFVLTNHHVQCPALASAAPSCLVSGNVCMRGDVCRQGWRDTQGDKHFSVEFAFFFFISLNILVSNWKYLVSTALISNYIMFLASLLFLPLAVWHSKPTGCWRDTPYTNTRGLSCGQHTHVIGPITIPGTKCPRGGISCQLCDQLDRGLKQRPSVHTKNMFLQTQKKFKICKSWPRT